jgi:hypothetical protein
MKKFGKRNLQIHNLSVYTDECRNIENEDEIIYEKEFSKKLNYSNSFDHSNKEKFLLFKKQKKSENKIEKEKIQNQQSDNLFNSESNSTRYKNTKLKRLSELEQTNLYFILNISQNSTKDNIKRAYKNLCLIHHPDKGGDSETFSKINKAYHILSNDICRELYDKFSHSAMTLIDQIINNTDTNISNTYVSEINLDLDGFELQFYSFK